MDNKKNGKSYFQFCENIDKIQLKYAKIDFDKKINNSF